MAEQRLVIDGMGLADSVQPGVRVPSAARGPRRETSSSLGSTFSHLRRARRTWGSYAPRGSSRYGARSFRASAPAKMLYSVHPECITSRSASRSTCSKPRGTSEPPTRAWRMGSHRTPRPREAARRPPQRQWSHWHPLARMPPTIFERHLSSRRLRRRRAGNT
jgi:hypothetical protein